MRPICLTVERRNALLLEVPTPAEAGLPGFVFENWWVCSAPAATPAPILAALSAAFQAGLAQNRERLAALGEELRPGFDTPEAVRAFLRGQVDQSVAVLRAAGVRPEQGRIAGGVGGVYRCALGACVRRHQVSEKK